MSLQPIVVLHVLFVCEATFLPSYQAMRRQIIAPATRRLNDSTVPVGELQENGGAGGSREDVRDRKLGSKVRTKSVGDFTPRNSPFISRWNNPLILAIDPNFLGHPSSQKYIKVLSKEICWRYIPPKGPKEHLLVIFIDQSLSGLCILFIVYGIQVDQCKI